MMEPTIAPQPIRSDRAAFAHVRALVAASPVYHKPSQVRAAGVANRAFRAGRAVRIMYRKPSGEELTYHLTQGEVYRHRGTGAVHVAGMCAEREGEPRPLRADRIISANAARVR